MTAGRPLGPRLEALRPPLLVTLAVSVLFTVAAAAQTPPPIGVELTPARVERDLDSRQTSLSFTVINHTDTAQTIRMSASGLGHDLDGRPLFIEPAQEASALNLSAQEFSLQTEGRRQVEARASIPEGSPALYAALITQFSEEQPPEGQIRAVGRVASLLLIRGPRPWVETAEVVDVGILPGDPPLTVYATVRDTGNVHIRPEGEVRITQEGTLIDVVPLKGEVILPSYARRLKGSWTPPPGLSGRVMLEAIIRNPDARGVGFADLAGGIPESRIARIEALRARDQDGPLVTLEVVNIGNVAFSPVVVIFAQKEGVEAARTVEPQPEITPGESRALQWRPGLQEGLYVITAQVFFEDALLDQKAVGFRLGEDSRGGWLSWLALLLLLIALAFLVFLLWKRRRKEEEKQDREPRVPEETKTKN